MARYELASENATAVIDSDGGRLASLRIFGQEVLVTEGDRPSRWGVFPMIPWCGRLAYGRLHWYGTEYQFPVASPPHANHGVAHTQNWDLLNASTTVLNISLDMGSPWTFGGTARQRFDLSDNQLCIEAQVEAGEYQMPVMIGWHPWFRRQLGLGGSAELAISPSHSYDTDADLIPTGAISKPGPPPWNHCFVGMKRPPSITWPGAIELTIQSDLDHWVVFTEPDHALCVEPQSGPPDEFNRQPRIIQPGQRFRASMTLTWQTA